MYVISERINKMRGRCICFTIRICDRLDIFRRKYIVWKHNTHREDIFSTKIRYFPPKTPWKISPPCIRELANDGTCFGFWTSCMKVNGPHDVTVARSRSSWTTPVVYRLVPCPSPSATATAVQFIEKLRTLAINIAFNKCINNNSRAAKRILGPLSNNGVSRAWI